MWVHDYEHRDKNMDMTDSTELKA
jgi:hypothetical protein